MAFVDAGMAASIIGAAARSLQRPGEHLGPLTLPFGPKMLAVPVSALWEVPRPD
ncbi:hypothetical protein IU449_18625 [Nocardia higoensis]|uniref:Uncharacterized protein n=1 Tax=Nocardia higoensis TaxID=228599 RepID=A0ABS0DDL2_9NOCA|nr:hypothetical protein [Nocardia higoensis]MBF6356535.1 hypothetical protein [Nocardia higoensis]